MMLLAEGTNAPVGIAAWLGCAAFALMLLNGGFKFARNVKGTEPHPPNSSLDIRVSKLESAHTDHAAEDKRELSKLEAKIESLRTEGSARGKYLHERIDDANSLLHQLAGHLGVKPHKR